MGELVPGRVLLRLEGVDGFALDGEIFPVAADGSLIVAATAPVSLLAL